MAGDAVIGKVISDLRLGRYDNVSNQPRERMNDFTAIARTAPVINATQIYESIIAAHEPVYIYEDHPCIAPPWDHAAVTYVNGHGNVHVMLVAAADKRRGDPMSTWETDNVVDWAMVRWNIHVAVFVGGLSDTLKEHVPTCGR